MGKKSGRSLNPADVQRKLERKKELKRNKKQRFETREAVVKSKDPEELIDQLRHVDKQIYDPERAGSADTLQTKRKKVLGSYISIIALARQQRNTEKVRDLQNNLDAYENERRTMEEMFNAVMFAREGSLEAVPLPSGIFTPADAMTPACMIPVPPPAPKIHTGILKKPIERKFRKVPPGPPCIPPPDYDDYGETAIVVRQGISKRSVKFDEQVREEEIPLEDDYGPVEIPPEIHNSGMPSLGTIFPSVMSIPIHQPPLQTIIPPRHIPVPHRNPSAVISAPAQVRGSSRPSEPSQPVISAAPQMRDLWKETTKFVPTNLHVKKNPSTSMKPRKTINYQQAAAQAAAMQRQQQSVVRVQQPLVPDIPSESATSDPDKATDDFLASLKDLL
ncbi:hypothetical protein FO519_001526 [Halicephalobus sp. NKZ332]|nr:hypothetical protein FO519_001526 [Halicephalobus sp. NKZ332]